MLNDRETKSLIQAAFNGIEADDKLRERVISRKIQTGKRRRTAVYIAAAVLLVLIPLSLTEDDSAELPPSRGREYIAAAATDEPIPSEEQAENIFASAEPRQSHEIAQQQYIPKQPDSRDTPQTKSEPAGAASDKDLYSAAMAVLGAYNYNDSKLEYYLSDITDRAVLSGDMRYNGSLSHIADDKEYRLYSYSGEDGREVNIINTSDDTEYVDEVLAMDEVPKTNVENIPVEDEGNNEYFFYMHTDDGAYVVNTKGLDKQENQDLLYSLGGE